MANLRKSNLRKRQVQELLLKGWKQYEIAEKLGVRPETISKDVKKLNEHYKRCVEESEGYLQRTTERIFEFLGKYDYIIKQLYELKDGSLHNDDDIEGLVDRFYPAIDFDARIKEGDYPDKEEVDEKKQRDADREWLHGRLNTIARSNVKNHTEILRELRNTLSEQAKILNLITGSKTYVQNNNYIHVDKLEAVFQKVSFMIERCVPEDRRIEAYTILKSLVDDAETKDDTPSEDSSKSIE